MCECMNTEYNFTFFLTGLLHAIPNDETASVKEAVTQHAKPAKTNGVFTSVSTLCVQYVFCVEKKHLSMLSVFLQNASLSL